MKRKGTGIILVCGLLGTGSPALAEEGKGYLGLSAGYTEVDGQRPNLFNGGPTWNVIGGYTLPLGFEALRVDLEGNAFGTYLDRRVGGRQDFHHGGGFDLRLRPVVSGSVTPYGLIGAGVVYEDRNFQEDFFGYANVGLGLRIATPFQHVALRGEGRYVAVNNHKDVPGQRILNDGRFTLGLEIALRTGPILMDSDGDGVIDGVDRCPDTPPGTKVDGFGCPVPLDSDGDGVPDDRDRCPGTPPGTPVDNVGCPLPPPTPLPAPVPPPAPAFIDSDGDGVPDHLDQCPNTPRGMRVDARGCVVEQVFVFPNITFELGSDRLTPTARNTLLDMVEGLRGQPNLRLEISGHTDSTGSEALNLALSKRRAQAVRDYLVSFGIAPSRLTVEGFGPFRPVASNDTEEGRARNRRVEFRVLNP